MKEYDMGTTTPEGLDHALAAALKAGDAAAVDELYEEGAVLMGQPGQPASTGIAAIRAMMEGFAALKPVIEMNPVVVAAFGDTAVIYNDYGGAGTAAEGSAVPLAGKAIEVAHRQPDGTWKFAFDDPWARG